MRRSWKENGVGRITVEFEVANFGDVWKAREKLLEPDKVRRRTVKGVVDSGATRFVLPEAVVKELELPLTGTVKVRYADGRSARRQMAEGAYVELLGRHGTFTAIVEPKKEVALVGAIVLEDLDLLVDCAQQRLIPRDPRGPVYEIE
jgi:predicted aspartyl protease